MSADDTVRTRVPGELKTDFEEMAARRGRTASQVLRDLMAGYVANERELDRRRSETLEALEDMAAGRLSPGEAVFDWLGSWGEPGEGEPPL